jgi:hypothetical protein
MRIAMRIAILVALLAANVLNAQARPNPTRPSDLLPRRWYGGWAIDAAGGIEDGGARGESEKRRHVHDARAHSRRSAIPPHWHPRQERATILSGAVDLGFGSVANAGNTKRYRAGSFYVNPPRVMHFFFFPEATEMQMMGIGPWELQTSDISAKAGETATATATVRTITPLPGSELAPSMMINAVVDYSIRNFKPSTCSLIMVFESTTPNRPFSIGPVVMVTGDRPLAPPGPNFLEGASGTVTLTQDLALVVRVPQFKRPARLRIFVQEQMNESSSLTAGMSDWIEFR